jgi:predicted membrane protein
MGAGKTTVDLTGDYAKSFDVSIQGGVGEATVLLPSDVGVKAKAEGGLGKINAEGSRGWATRTSTTPAGSRMSTSA